MAAPDKIRPMKILIFLVALPLMAADPPGFAAYTGAQIQSKAKAAKIDEHKVGLDRVANWGNHSLLLVHREGDGEVEVHDTQVDVINVISGEGTLLVGGTLSDGHTDRKSTRLNSSHPSISYAVFCLKKKK